MGHPAGNGKGVSRGLKPVFLAWDGIAQAEAWAYLRNKGKGKGQYGDSGCARMTNIKQTTAGSFDCVWRKSAPNSAQDDSVGEGVRESGSRGAPAHSSSPQRAKLAGDPDPHPSEQSSPGTPIA
jgi:hypothetical protein